MAIPNHQNRKLQEQIQLWQTVRKHFNKTFKSSLCAFFVDIKTNGVIDFTEYLYLTRELRGWAEKNGIDPNKFFWPKGESAPRKKFLDDRIKRLTAELDLLCKS